MQCDRLLVAKAWNAAFVVSLEPPPQAPPGGRWLDRDTNACLNFQRIGESMQRPLELCSWKDREALPPIGKEYQQGYKRVNDRLPKVKQRLHRAAEYRRGIDGVAADRHVRTLLFMTQEDSRYWIDFQVLSSPLSTTLLERALRAVGGPPKLDPVSAAVQKHKDYGYMHLDDWDLLWSITAKAMLAAEILRPGKSRARGGTRARGRGQVVSIVPGLLSVSRKTSLVSTLRLAYGDHTAFSVVPLTFKLPEELDACGLWMLKNNRQRGEGLRLVDTRHAFDAVWETTRRPGLEGMVLYRWYLAQQYIARPLTIAGYKFGIRVWVLVPGLNPLRVYMHTNGLALFSSHNVAPGHVTNYAQNENGRVWSLTTLRDHLPPAAWHKVWQGMMRSTSLVFAAALPRAHEVQRQMALPPQSCFQFFGLDFLLDEQYAPWLLEVNATPSMKVEHSDAATLRVIHDQKWPVVRDMVTMLRLGPERFTTGRRPVREHRGVGFMAGELAARGGFVPLMHMFPKRLALRCTTSELSDPVRAVRPDAAAGVAR
ncbi:hypothetical protein QJQ45_013362 [Haematococcus lacustris]|nr:hypothetical protein QJQ45_013362 [Haematococcus lacustris]